MASTSLFARSKQELAILVLNLDAPKCKCKPEEEPICHLTGRPCRDDEGNILPTGTCECPVSSPPCEHIRAQHSDLTDAELIELLWTAFPLEYGEPRLPRPRLLTRGKFPVRTAQGLAMPDVMVWEERFERGQARTHPDDHFIEDDERHARIAHTDACRNGSLVLGDLVESGAAGLLKFARTPSHEAAQKDRPKTTLPGGPKKAG